MALYIKDGVRFVSTVEAMLYASIIVDQVCTEMGVACILVGGIEEHEYPSKHIHGAKDYRTKHFVDDTQRRKFERIVRERLNDWFYVELEFSPAHLHIQYPPKNSGM